MWQIAQQEATFPNPIRNQVRPYNCFLFEMGLEETGFNLEFVRISWGI